MKNIKKIVVVVLTFVLSFLLINDVSAATNGSITINGTTKDKVYDIYKIFNLTYSGNETNKKVAYTIDSSWENFFKEGQLGAKYIVSTNSGNLNQITIGSQTKYINITESNVANFAQDALTYLGKTSSITKTDSKKATGNTLKFENLSLGYYLIYPNGATEIKDGYASIASLTSTTPDATEEIKATYPTINKTVKENLMKLENMLNLQLLVKYQIQQDLLNMYIKYMIVGLKV